MRDWRGAELAVGDTVVWPYAWGGMRLALCEGTIQSIDEDDETAVVYVMFDAGDYDRYRSTVKLTRHRLTRVVEREMFG